MKKTLLSLLLCLALCAGMAVSAAASAQPAGKTVTVSTADELYEALDSDTTIILEGGTYDVGPMDSNTMFLSDLSNLTLQGSPGTRLVSHQTGKTDLVFQISDCANVVLKDLIFVGADDYWKVPLDAAMHIYDSSVTVENCQIIGADTGLMAMRTQLTMKGCTLQNCDKYGVNLVDTDGVFEDCVFDHNGYGVDYPGWGVIGADNFDASVTARFTGCTFLDNNHTLFMKEGTSPDYTITYTTEHCRFSGNKWSDPADTGSVELPADPIAYASTQEIEVDGNKVTFEAYALKDANGNDTNYIKLRDVAQVLNGTAAQFEVGWDGTRVTITTGQPYTPNGTEMSTPYSGDRAYTLVSEPTRVDGSDTHLSAIRLTDDSGSGYTYYKLRDLGTALGFKVDWSAERGIFIETN